MSPKHRYALPNSPGRLLTTAGAISMAVGIAVAASLGRADSLVNGFGHIDLLAVLGPYGDSSRTIAVAILLAYPALYALNVLAETWTSSGLATWFGRRLRGSLCLLWSALSSAILALHVLRDPSGAWLFAGTALVFAIGGIAVRWLARHQTPSYQPLARAVPAFLFTFAAVGVAAIQVQLGTRFDVLDGLLASGASVGATLLFVGAVRDVVHQLQHTPRHIFDREGVQRSLRSS